MCFTHFTHTCMSLQFLELDLGWCFRIKLRFKGCKKAPPASTFADIICHCCKESGGFWNTISSEYGESLNKFLRGSERMVTHLVVESRMISVFSFPGCNHCPVFPVTDFFFHPILLKCSSLKGKFILCFETFQNLLMNCFPFYWMSHESKALSCSSTMSNALGFLGFSFRRLLN